MVGDPAPKPNRSPQKTHNSSIGQIKFTTVFQPNMLECIKERDEIRRCPVIITGIGTKIRVGSAHLGI